MNSQRCRSLGKGLSTNSGPLSHFSIGVWDNSKEDVWSIGCIIVEMMIKTILFHPQNDEPSLQLRRIVDLVGGLQASVIEQFPPHARQLFPPINCDALQLRLPAMLKQVFIQYGSNAEHKPKENCLRDLLSRMFQFQSANRLSLQSCIEHPFFANDSPGTHCSKPQFDISPHVRTRPMRATDLIHLCTQLHLERPRWVLTLKQRCLLQVILHTDNCQAFKPQKYGLPQSLQNELRNFVSFLTGHA